MAGHPDDGPLDGRPADFWRNKVRGQRGLDPVAAQPGLDGDLSGTVTDLGGPSSPRK